MKWSQLSIGKKIVLAFGLLLLLLFITVAFSFKGMDKITNNAAEVIRANQLTSFLANVEIDHVNWLSQVNILLSDEKKNTLNDLTNHRQCKFGQWLSGEERGQAQQLIAAVKPLLESIEKTHQKLHESVLKINEVFQPADVRLPAQFVEAKVELLHWASKINLALIKQKEALDVPMLLTESRFGVWLASDQAMQAKMHGSESYQKSLEQMKNLLTNLLETFSNIEMGMTAFAELERSSQKREEVFEEWDKITEELRQTITQAREKIVLPAKRLMISISDVEQIVYWNEIDLALDRWFLQTLEVTGAAVARIPREDSSMLPGVLEKNRERLNTGISEWKKLADRDPNLADLTKTINQQTGSWVVGGLKYSDAAMVESAAISGIEEIEYIYEEETLPQLTAMMKILDKLKGHAQDALRAKSDAEQIYSQQAQPALAMMAKSLRQVVDETKKAMVTDRAMLQAAQRSKLYVSMVGGGAILIGLILSMLSSRGITRALKPIALQLFHGADQLTSVSSQISTTSRSLAERTAEQAASLEETAASMEEVASKTKQNAKHSQESNQLMKKTESIARAANESMGRLELSMVDISKASKETLQIIKNIDEIAYQTNLLALNAAVEAARAGESGAGFAVVADEVRNLALRSAEAVKNTSALIENIDHKVSSGSELMAITNDNMGRLEESINAAGKLSRQISEASNDQAMGVEQVNTAITGLDSVTQQNAAGAQESAASAEQLNAHAEEQKQFSKCLQTLFGGKLNGQSSDNGNLAADSFPVTTCSLSLSEPQLETNDQV